MGRDGVGGTGDAGDVPNISADDDDDRQLLPLLFFLGLGVTIEPLCIHPADGSGRGGVVC
jgi:hypothetical protein